MEQGLLAPAPVWSNAKTFPWEKFHGKVHFIIGGYPCQPFSVAGNQGGINDPRHLWPFIYKGIEAIKPVGCFFENVPGHIGIGYRKVRQDLERLGYTVEEGIFSAELFLKHRKNPFDPYLTVVVITGLIQWEMSHII